MVTNGSYRVKSFFLAIALLITLIAVPPSMMQLVFNNVLQFIFFVILFSCVLTNDLI